MPYFFETVPAGSARLGEFHLMMGADLLCQYKKDGSGNAGFAKVQGPAAQNGVIRQHVLSAPIRIRFGKS